MQKGFFFLGVCGAIREREIKRKTKGKRVIEWNLLKKMVYSYLPNWVLSNCPLKLVGYVGLIGWRIFIFVFKNIIKTIFKKLNLKLVFR